MASDTKRESRYNVSVFSLCIGRFFCTAAILFWLIIRAELGEEFYLH